MSESIDGLLINAELLLEWGFVGEAAYVESGVPKKGIKGEPFYTWLPQVLRCDIEEASVYQIARDGKLTAKLFQKPQHASVREGIGLNIAHLFVEARRPVFVVSHETPDALDAIIARAGLPSSVVKIALAERGRRTEVIEEITREVSWLMVFDRGLTSPQERAIVDRLAGNGVLVNVRGLLSGAHDAEEQLLELIGTRWTA